MKRHPSLLSLSRDHYQGLLTAQLIKRNSPNFPNLPSTVQGKRDYLIRFYQDELITHFLNEEKIVFPTIVGKSSEIDKLIGELTDEHRRIENLIDMILTSKNVENILNILGVTLEIHIRKEEKILFTRIQELVSSEEMDKIGRILARTRRAKNGQ